MVPTEYMLRVRMTDDDRKMLEHVAKQRGITPSEWVRKTIHEAYGVTREPSRRERDILVCLKSHGSHTIGQLKPRIAKLWPLWDPRMPDLDIMLASLSAEGFIVERDGRFDLTDRGRKVIE
jgi:hypothetical protein